MPRVVIGLPSAATPTLERVWKGDMKVLAAVRISQFSESYAA